MNPRLCALAFAGALLLAGCGSSTALDDAADPASASASASESASPSGSASPSESRTASPSTKASESPLPAASAPGVEAATPATLQLDFDGTSGTFTWDGGYSTCPGAPWGGVTGGSSITITGASSGCPEVATWFLDRISADLETDDYLNTAPSTLAYAITGTLSIGGADFPTTIGHDPSSASGGWLIGGPGWVTGNTDGIPNLCTPDSGGQQYYLLGTASQDSFTFVQSDGNCG